MTILAIKTSSTGLAAVVPNVIHIDTDNTVAEVTTAGFLNGSSGEGIDFNNKQMALVSTQNAGVATCGWYNVSVAVGTGVVTLTAV